MTKSGHNLVTDKLISLGFSQHEAEVYLSVVGNGEASAGVVLDELDLHREQVYRSLKRLTDRGLLNSYKKHKKQFYSPTDPDLLFQRAQEQVAVAKSVVPLINLMRTIKPQTIQVYEGIEGVKNNLEEILQVLDQGGEYLVMGGSGKNFYQVTDPFWKAIQKKYLQKKIKGRIIYYQDQPYSPAKDDEGPVLTPDKSSGVGVVTCIYGNRGSLQIIDPQNLAIITITNQRIADSYRHTFEILWRSESEVMNKQHLDGLLDHSLGM